MDVEVRVSKNLIGGGAAIAQWICLSLPSLRPGFESQAHHLCFFQFILFKFYICHLECGKNKQKEAGIGPLKEP